MKDVALHAGVGVATVDRVLNGRAPVTSDTAQRVLDAAQSLGFHATALFKRRLEGDNEERTLAFLLQKSSQSFYQAMGRELAHATRAFRGIRGKSLLAFLDDLTPAHVAARIDELATKADALAVVAADHPKVSAAVERATTRGVPVFTLLSDLSTPARTGFIGIDHRKAGRSAGWAMARLARQPGALGIFIGSHRYLGHELSEISFRSFIRENAPAFRLLEPLANFEDVHFAQEATGELLRRNPDLVGIYVAGGGIEGVIEAIRDVAASRDLVLVCNELVPETRAGLIDGIVDVVISTPLVDLARCTVAEMVEALRDGSPRSRGSTILPFQILIAENL